MAATGAGTLVTIRVGVSGSALNLHFSPTSAADFYLESWSNAAAPTGAYSISDAAAAGTTATAQNAMTALSLSGALSGATTGAFSTSLVVGSDPGTSSPLRVNGESFLTGNITTNSSLYVGGNGHGVFKATSDGTDNQYSIISGGGQGGAPASRGAYVFLGGNENTLDSTTAGRASLIGGLNSTAGAVALCTGASQTPRLECDYGGNISLNGPLVFASPAPAASPTLRAIHTNGSTTDLYTNVPSGGQIFWTIAGAAQSFLTSSGYTLSSGDVIFGTAGAGLRTNTSDGSDSKYIRFNGGGGLASGNTRGANAQFSGNEEASTPGVLALAAGDVSGGGNITLTTHAIERLKIAYDGTVSGGVVNATSGLLGLDASGNAVVGTSKLISGGLTAASVNTGLMYLSGGAGGNLATNGAIVSCYGVSHGSLPGDLWLEAGTTTGDVYVTTNGSTQRLKIDESGLKTDSCGLVARWQTKTGNYTMIANDYGIFANGNSASLNVTLPANTNGRTVHIKRIDSVGGNTVTVIPPSGTIRGAANITLAASYAAGYEAILVGDGTNWH